MVAILFKQILRIFALIMMLSIIGSCATPVNKIIKNPDKFQGKKVIVRGRVVSSLDLKDLNSFSIRHKTGIIMVVTENLLPLKNDKVRVKGVFEKNFQYKDKTMMVIKEKKMKVRKMAEPGKEIKDIYKENEN